MEILGYVSFIFMGITLGLVGGGGSILTVPILVYIFKLDPIIATSYSLMIVGLSSFAGSLDYQKKKLIDLRTAILFSIPSLSGVYIVRKYALTSIPDDINLTGLFILPKKILIMLVFSIVILSAARKMIQPQLNTSNTATQFKTVQILFYGLIIGFLSGFVGAGGGFLIIPALTAILNLPMRVAIGTSLTIIAIQSTVGFLLSTTVASTNWLFLIIAISLAILGIFIGTKLNPYTSEKKLKLGFGYFILIVGLLIFIEQTRQVISSTQLGV